ncbi:uncharacterized protein LOC111912799 isoform X2 [Lactuca sativa]|uniref:uncharacterized protein LOC111912799 isoform X2 n=1 Tax=Lactuca sativa TaxID=4236 RepID=UPI001C68AC79|nr:uncharacterized protein LOC111912799 isoform X2 [Lactuca sativa]
MTSLFLVYLLFLLPFLCHSLPLCRNSCGNIEIDYPFAVDDGCGATLYRNMLNCSTTFATNTTISTTDLFFETPSGSYKVESIDYASKSLTIYDPSMSTCTILQPHHDFVLSDVQSALIPPSPDTVFALMNCSIDSPVLNHYKSLCFNFSDDHSCDELYGSCTSFKIFQMLSNDTPPACCFTSYNTVKFMSMNILDCTHYTTFYDADKLKGEKPLDWSYGMKLSYGLPDTGCDRCRKSGGTCGFDVETEGTLCICSAAVNSTRECGTVEGGIGEAHTGSVLPSLLSLSTILFAFSTFFFL